MRSITLRTGHTRPAAEEWLHTCIARVQRERAGPAPGSSQSAVPSPWQVVQRYPSGDVVLQHVGAQPLYRASFTLAGEGLLGLTPPRTVLPGEYVSLAVRGVLDSAGSTQHTNTAVVVRWQTPEGRQLLWPLTW